ncbi:hypothetical protein F6455_08355 [Proteobacteria bacterium 005FR1]|nr:hypothetical protein [Proteobacteria bacterium 005FR1]
MKCSDIKSQLEKGAGNTGLKSLAEHLRACRDCREYADDLRTQRLLSSLPMPKADPDFERRVLNAAFAAAPAPDQALAKRRGGLAPLAAAAGLVVAVLVGLLWQNNPVFDASLTAPGGELASEQGSTQFQDLEPVQLVLNSGRTLESVTLTIDLPAHLALKGYADSRHLQWNADLTAGANKLVLPVQVRSDLYEALQSADSEIVVMLEHQGRRKEFRVPVQPQLRSSGNDRSTQSA